MEKSRIITVQIKPYTGKELSVLFNMSKRTFNRNIKGIREQLGIRIGHYWNIHQIELIIAHMGRPYQVIELEIPDKQKEKSVKINFDIQKIETEYKQVG